MTLPTIMITPETEALRRDLAKIWNLAPFRVEVGLILTNGELFITVDDQAPTNEQCEAFAVRASKVAAAKRQIRRQQRN